MTLHCAAACSHHRAGALPSGAHAAARNSHCRWVTAKTETTLRVHAGSYSPLFGEAYTAALEAGGA